MAVTQVIIFDLDGTLVDSARDIAFAVNGMLTDRGLEALPLERILPLIGEGARRLVARALVAGGETEIDTETALKEFLAFYAANLTRSTRAYPGVRETLDNLRTTATGSPSARTNRKATAVPSSAGWRWLTGSGCSWAGTPSWHPQARSTSPYAYF